MNLKRIINIVEEKMKNDEFSGVVIVKENEKDIFSDTYGYAHRGLKVPVTTSTIFQHASVTKVFTAVAILQLIEKGLISFDTKLVEYLDLKDDNFSKDIAIKHLLTHSSGIGDYFDESDDDFDLEAFFMEVPNYSLINLQKFYELTKNKESKFAPGEKFEYSNSGYIMLGLIIEKASGMNYFDYVRENVFKKAGLVNTDYIPLNKVALKDNMAQGYSPVFDDDDNIIDYKANIFMAPPPASDGGASSDAQDLFIFMKALREGKLLSEKMTQFILTPQITDAFANGYNWQYSCGVWFVSDDAGVVRYGLTGEDPGASARYMNFPRHNIEAVILSNIDEASGSIGWELMQEIVKQ